jgi:hypothetical protein
VINLGYIHNLLGLYLDFSLISSITNVALVGYSFQATVFYSFPFFPIYNFFSFDQNEQVFQAQIQTL